jgi:Spy/CpxP family protein refolding chaperone
MRMRIGLVVIALVCASLLTARGADEKAESKGKGGGRLTQPWSKISSISDDQKSKIVEIHKKANDERKAIDKREHDEIMALLTDDQKKEAEALEGSKSSKKKDDAAPASAPAQ